MQSTATETSERSPRRPWRLSLRWRLTIWIVIITLIIELILALITLFYQHAGVEEYFQESLRVRANLAATAIADRDLKVTDSELTELTCSAFPFLSEEKFFAALYSETGEVIASTRRPALPAARFDRHRRAGERLVVDRIDIPELRADTDRPPRLIMLTLADPLKGKARFALVSTDRYADPIMRLVPRLVLLTLPSGVLATAFAAWLIAGLAVRPLEELRRIAESLTPETLDDPVAPPTRRHSSPEYETLRRDLEDVRSRLRIALHAQDRFIANVSHELKTPVAVLLTEAQTLETEGLTADQQRFVGSVTEEMRRLGRMVESFLSLTRVRAGKTLANIQRCHINDIVMDSVETCTSMAKQYSVRISPELDASGVLRVDGDLQLLRTMLDNLLRSAIRFSPERGCVSISVHREGGQCLIRVRDSGAGIPAELVDKLFDRFAQAASERVRGRGQGLGLAIAQGVAELHGGSISARNLDEGGCEFEARLPAAPERA